MLRRIKLTFKRLRRRLAIRRNTLNSKQLMNKKLANDVAKKLTNSLVEEHYRKKIAQEQLDLSIDAVKPKLFNIEIQLGTDPISGDPIQYFYKKVPHYRLNDTSIMIEFESKTISSKYDIVHITEITKK